jgi:hypothetical protein
MARWLVVVAVVALAEPGCGSGSDDATADAGVEGGMDGGVDFLQTYAHAKCAGRGPCCQAVALPFDENECERFEFGEISQLATEALEAGASLDPEAGQACINALEQGAVSCSSYPTIAEVPCSRIWSGHAPLGTACATSYDCATSADGQVQCFQVIADGGVGSSYCQVLHEPAHLGDPCGAELGAPGPHPVEGDCTFGNDSMLRCDPATFTCAPRLQIGQACAGNDCAAGAYCSTSGSCVAQVGLGTTCSSSLACQTGLRCVSSVCAPLAQVGDPCRKDGDCASGACVGPTCAANALHSNDCTGILDGG